MSVTYSADAITDRMQGVVTAVDAGGGNGYMYLRVGSSIISTIQLARPCGIVNGGVLTFSGTLLDPAATGTGYVDNVIVTTSTGGTTISGLTVGIPLSGADVIIHNGANSTLITAGQTVSVLSAQITGS